MKHLRSLSCSVFVLAFVPSLAAAEPSLVEWTQQRVQAGILKPLAERTRTRFSRSAPEPLERRIRVTQTELSRDAQGHDFVPFAVDQRYAAGEWRSNIVGCAYRASGKLFVKIGPEFFPAAYLLGKKVSPLSGVCQAEAARS